MEEQIEVIVRNTVGYFEAEDKSSFMRGANVGYSKAKEYYETQISELQKRLEMAEDLNTEARNDFRTLTDLIDKYGRQD